MIDLFILVVALAIAAGAAVFFFALIIEGVKTGRVPVRSVIYHETDEPILFWASLLIYFLVSALFASIPVFILWEIVTPFFSLFTR